MRLPILILSLCLVTLPVGAQEPEATATAAPAPVTVRATAEPLEVTIGDPIRYRVQVTAAAEVEVRVPLLAGRQGDFEIVDFGEEPPRKEGGNTTITRWYTLTAFQVGARIVPAPKAEYRTPGGWFADVEGNTLTINVRALLPEGSTNIEDIAPPLDVPLDWRPLALALAAITVFGLAIAGFYLLVRRPARVHVVPPPPAHEVALAALGRLRTEGYLEQGKFEAYYVELSAIIRRYLEDGMKVRAPEMTTEEFLNTAAAANARLTSQQRRLLGEFLSQADLVKFARHLPTLEDTAAAYEAARRFIDETRPQSITGDVPRAAA